MFRRVFNVSAKARNVFKTSQRFAGILPQKETSSNSRFAKAFLGFTVATFATVTIACILKKEELMAMCYNGEQEDDKRRFSLPLTRNFVADVVEAVSPAVVNIACMSSSYMGVGISGGSGFIINKEGIIVTNAHVVANGDNSDNIVVTMKSGRKRRASLYAMDILSDIAVLKLEDMDDEVLPVAPLGQSSRVRSGEFVIAIGSPMFLQNSASLGIVSATARHASELGISNNRSEYIQTDAAVNVGNSGGPLVNLDGEVIGINTLKVKGTDGISLAIPIDIASQIVRQLVQFKRVVRPYVGLKMAEMVGAPQEYTTNRKYRKTHKYPDVFQEPKVVVLEVQKNSPAHLSGIQSGDVITSINQKTVHSVRDVLDEIGLEVGRELILKIVRGGDGGEREVKLVTSPETAKRF